MVISQPGSCTALEGPWLARDHDPLARVTQHGELASQRREARQGGESGVNRIERGTPKPIDAKCASNPSGIERCKPPRPLGPNSPCRAGRREAAAKEHVACMWEDLDRTAAHDGCVSLPRIAQLCTRLKRLRADSHPLVEARRKLFAVRRCQKDVHPEGSELAFARS